MEWQKLGLIFEPSESNDWMETHAQLPVALHLEGDRYRIYFAGRNEENMSQTGYVELDLTTPDEPEFVTAEPVLELGPLGTFDDSGVYPSSVVNLDDEVRLYYIGWMQGKRVPYYASVGLARSTDGGETFTKVSRAPHLSRTEIDPYMTLSSDILYEGGIWRMWYTSATTWEPSKKPRPNYHIKYAESDDGLEWKREGTVAIGYHYRNEWAIARPTVVRTDDGYQMWYSYVRGDQGYRIGYAESDDGVEWKRRDDNVGIGTSAGAWDSNLQAYPYVFEHQARLYMLYNGNDYGKDGFGLAVQG